MTQNIKGFEFISILLPEGGLTRVFGKLKYLATCKQHHPFNPFKLIGI